MRLKNRARLFYLVTFLLASILFAASSDSQGRPVHVIALSDEIINPVTAEYIEKSIDKAAKEKAECLVIELDTPGGLLTSTRAIVRSILNSSVPVVVYVYPGGARAGSAGVFITLAGNIAAMAPSTNIGAAHPVELEEKRSSQESIEDILGRLLEGKEGKEGTKKQKPPATPMQDKILNDSKAWAQAIADHRGRNEKWALAAVEESVSVTEGQAKSEGVIDLVAVNLDDLLTRIDGRVVEMPQGKVTLHTKGAPVIEMPMNFRLRALSILAHPNIAYILLMLGFYGLLFEFTHPGTMFPGIAGTISIILAFFGLQVLPTNYAGIALIVVGIILFIAEVKITSYGLLTIGGLISLFFGSLILFASPYEFMRVSLPLVLSFVVATLAIAVFLTTIAIRSQRRKVKTGMEGLIGGIAEVRTWKDKRGKVFIHGELWEAESDNDLGESKHAEIVGFKGMKLIVNKSG